MAFSSSLEFGYVVLGLFFPFPNSQSNWQVRLRCLIAADTDRRSNSPLPPGTMSSILLAKHVSFEHSVSSPRPVITSRREEKNNKAKVFQHPIDSHSQSASSCLISPHFAAGASACCRSRPRCSEFLSNWKYRYRSYTQTDDTHCWPWAIPFTNHQQHTQMMCTANHWVSKYRNQAQKLEEKQSCGAHQTDNGRVGWDRQIHTSRLPQMIRNHMYTRLYQVPCQLCLTTSLLATDGISHERPRFFTLVQPWRTSISLLYDLFYSLYHGPKEWKEWKSDQKLKSRVLPESKGITLLSLVSLLAVQRISTSVLALITIVRPLA